MPHRTEVSLSELIDGYCLKLTTIDAPVWFINAEFTVVLVPEFAQISANTPLEFAPNLLQVLCSPTPPSVDFFATLPSPRNHIWAVYALIMVKPDCEPLVYIGSGTNAQSGCSARTPHYNNKTHASLPRFVRQAYDQGYELLHIGLLCWAPLPLPTMVPRSRLYFLGLEAVFTCVFYTSFASTMDATWTHLMPWTRDSVSWGPLNSHLPLTEGVGTPLLNLTPDQLALMATMRKARVQIASKAHYDRERAQDLDAFLTRKRNEKAAWAKKNADRVAVFHAKTIAKVKSERKFYCSVCDIALASSTALQSHVDGPKHKEQVALSQGAPKPTPSKDALRTRKFNETTRADRRFYCRICNHTTVCAAKLAIHKKTKRHLRKAALAAP